MLDIGSRLEPLVDTFLIETLRGLTLRLHHPQPANRALTFDRPWEGAFCGYATVIQDEDRFRLYYRGWPRTVALDAVTCYAESEDGVTFERPVLGLHEAEGERDTNVILVKNDGTHNFAPFRDSRPGIPEDERYKALASDSNCDSPALCAYASADGIRWRRLQQEPVLTKGAFDSQNVAFWSARENCYVAFYRTWHGAVDPTQFLGQRTVSRSTSDDFTHWSEPVEMSYGDTPREELYTNQTHPYFRAPHIYVATPMRFLPHRQRMTEELAREFGVIDTYWQQIADGVFMTSRGEDRYDRTFMEGFLRPGPDLDNWVSRTNMAACGVVQTGPREMSIYYQHRYAQPAQYLMRYTMRLDGFSSVNAPYAGGELLTKPLRFTGSKLQLNMATSAPGSVQVEIQDEQGTPLAGHSLAEADLLYGDDIDRTVTWQGSHDLRKLAGRQIRLRMVMSDADLYALRFA